MAVLERELLCGHENLGEDIISKKLVFATEHDMSRHRCRRTPQL